MWQYPESPVFLKDEKVFLAGFKSDVGIPWQYCKIDSESISHQCYLSALIRVEHWFCAFFPLGCVVQQYEEDYSSVLPLLTLLKDPEQSFSAGGWALGDVGERRDCSMKGAAWWGKDLMLCDNKQVASCT